MKDLLDKLSSYNIFNYLLPGIIFVVISKELTPYSFIQGDLILGVFVYYFIGLIISRVGSLIIEPICIKTGFIKYANYKKYLQASKKDQKIEILLEVNNMYRTIFSTLLLVLILKSYGMLVVKYQFPKELSEYILIILSSLLFIYSYRKQTQYIVKRILN